MTNLNQHPQALETRVLINATAIVVGIAQLGPGESTLENISVLTIRSAQIGTKAFKEANGALIADLSGVVNRLVIQPGTAPNDQ